MGIRYEQHSDMCGCERCAKQWETENPRPVFDAIEDPDILACGCHCNDRCRCDEYDDHDEPDDYEDACLDECGMMADGQCTLAGSEWCDWDCPRGGLTKLATEASEQ